MIKLTCAKCVAVTHAQVDEDVKEWRCATCGAINDEKENDRIPASYQEDINDVLFGPPYD